MMLSIRHRLFQQICNVNKWRATRESTVTNYCSKLDPNDITPKSVTEQFTESMRVVAEQSKLNKLARPAKYEKTKKWVKPDEDYTPRFAYNGYLKKTTWRFFDEQENDAKSQKSSAETLSSLEANSQLKTRNWKKYCLLMAFAGSNYFGMQFNPSVPTIEDELFKAMIKCGWILKEHVSQPWLVEFQRGSRTDRGVSAARQCCSILLPKDVNVSDLNNNLPAAVRVFGIKRVTPKFDARYNCGARTYSYTLPTVAFAHYNDQTEMKDYRLPADRLTKVNQVLASYKGKTNFHNYTWKKEFFDKSSQRRIDSIECSPPFIESGIEFARITVKGESFMLHQIRKMVGFSLAVIRGIISEDLLRRSLTNESFNLPTAPGLGLMLERLHFDRYDRAYSASHEPLTWHEFDADVEQFRSKQIHPVIIGTEINEKSMVNWLEYLCIHSFDSSEKEEEENRRYGVESEYDNSWGESEDFMRKLEQVGVKPKV